MYIRYSPELLRPIVEDSVSLSEVLRKLGGKWSGGRQQHIRSLIQKFGLDTSHFLGKGANVGNRHRGGTHKKTPEEVLVVLSGSRREQTYRLRRALIESGVEEICQKCGLGPEWDGQRLTLEIDHVNREWSDCRRENLRFLCPNCHSQLTSRAEIGIQA